MATPNDETRVDSELRYFKNNRFIAGLILIGLVIMGLSKVVESGDSILRILGIEKSYSVDMSTDRGKFSASLAENAWSRMFWMRAYIKRARINATQQEQNMAWQKNMEATEKWSSNIMNYYLGLEEYYPKTKKRIDLEDTIQPKFDRAGRMVSEIKFTLDTADRTRFIPQLDSMCIRANNLIDTINTDLYSLVDYSIKKK